MQENQNIPIPPPKTKHSAIGDLLTTFIFYVAILFFFIGFNFTDRMAGNWYQQFMPTGLPNFQISDITFLDSLTGFAVTGNGSPNDSSGYILRTTNGGNNWQLQHGEYRDFSRVIFLNNNTGYVSGGYNTGSRLYKTINGGTNWNLINGPGGQIFYDDLSVLSQDTIWIAISQTATGGVFRTTNGGASWDTQVNLGGNNPDRIYMYNARIGFISRTNATQLRKTTNGGVNWNLVTGTGTGAFNDLYFIDSLTGWKAKAVGGGGWLMGKSTDGGFNWAEQILPFGGNISSGSEMRKFDNLNKDTIWGVGGVLFYPGQGARAFLYRTTNGGNTWYFQIPDTSYQIPSFSFVNFVDKYKGWAYTVGPRGIHTTIGGDTVFYLGIQQISSNIPKDFELKQNYPNPFNPRTVIPYSIKKSAYVRLIAYEVTGKETQVMVNQHQSAGEYEVDFIGKFAISSGVYFYRLTVNDAVIATKKMILIK